MNLSMIVSWLQARTSSDEQGAALVEYGLLVALIAVVAIGFIVTLGGQVAQAFNSITQSL